MNWFSKLFERRAVTPELAAAFMGGSVAAGVDVTPSRALEVPAVFACVQVLSQDVARTTVKFRRRVGDDAFIDAHDHDLYEILASLPNPEQTSYQFKHAMQWQLLLHGRAYAEVVRHNGRVVALWPLQSERMRVDRNERGVKRWTYQAGAKSQTWLFDPSQPPIFELVHETPIVRCRELIGTALALQTFVARFFSNSARPGGVLQSEGAIGPEQAYRLREYWQSMYRGVDRSHQIAVLEGGLKWQSISQPNDESQLNESMLAISQQIAGVFRVPPAKVGDWSKANYSNLEISEMSYIQSTLDPYYECWESAIRRDLLTDRQYRQFSAVFDRAALIRSDTKSLHESLSIGIQGGFFSINDARRALNLNPVQGGDDYRVNESLRPVAVRDPVAA